MQFIICSRDKMKVAHFLSVFTLVFGFASRASGGHLTLSVESPLVRAAFGQSVVVSCIASPESSENVIWERPDAGGIIGNSKQSNVFSSHEKGSLKLVIRKARTEDEGVYMCQENSVSSKSGKAFFILQVSGPPKFDKPYEAVTVQKGSDVTLYCNASGDPAPDYVWLDKQNSVAIGSEVSGNGDRKMAISSYLYFYEVTEDSNGLYTCRANNSLGTESKIYGVTVVSDPEPVEDGAMTTITVKSKDQTSVTFELQAVKMETFEGFKTEYASEKFFGWNNGTESWKIGEEYTVGSLVPGSTYYFRFSVYPRNTYLWSDDLIVTLPLLRPDIIIQEVSPQKVRIQTFEPIDVITGRSIDHYRLRYKSITQFGGKEWNFNNTCEIETIIPYPCLGSGFEVSGLQRNTYYYFVLQSHNSLGYSEPADFKINVK